MEDVIKLLEDQIKKIDREIEHNDELIYNHYECKKTLEILNKNFAIKRLQILDAIAQLDLTN
jgi:hypothetical protein